LTNKNNSCAIFREHSEKGSSLASANEYKNLNQIIDLEVHSTSSDDGVEETLLPIPNRKVKLYSVDGTAWDTVWESRTLLG
jgi:hypothetical protein